ncbi:MAG: LLM class flavin-dependent oxidoreductase [Gordonia sp. (in: high G+C Gram-positive bacteria)]
MNAGPHGVGHWKHPASDNTWFRPDFYLNVARILEEARFDLIFFADSLAVPRSFGGTPDTNIRYGVGVPRLDPIPVISLLVAATEHIGLAATSSTGFQQPYNIARQFSTLDHLSGGRVGWNVVTSFQDAEARNFGADKLAGRSERYRRADEFIQVVARLWDTWDEDAVILDSESGIFADPGKVHELGFHGDYYGVEGPLAIPRSPQGYPVIVQAGSSHEGKDFAARWADVIFTSHVSLESAQDFYADVKTRAARYGRSPDDVKILPSVTPIVAHTHSDAIRLKTELDALVPAEAGLARLAYHLDADLTKYDLDKPLPELDVQGVNGHYREVVEITRREGFTLRELGRWYGSRNEGDLVGTPEVIADRMEQWFLGYAADGFTVSATHTPGAFAEFTDLVLPELRRRGLARTDYTGQTLRENLGVPRPAPGEWAARLKREDV